MHEPTKNEQQISETAAFLRRLAKILEANGLPGQAGNCTIQAQKLEQIVRQT